MDDNERLQKHCGLCGAIPGELCTVVSFDDVKQHPGEVRTIPHYYRIGERPYSVLWKDEGVLGLREPKTRSQTDQSPSVPNTVCETCHGTVIIVEPPEGLPYRKMRLLHIAGRRHRLQFDFDLAPHD